MGKPIQIVLATRNAGKLREMRQLLAEFPIEWLSLGDYPQVGEIAEDGFTFEENARKKARAVAEATGLWALADDSGLEVEALGGRPGVHSARFAGDQADDAANLAHLAAELRGVGAEASRAAFRCVLILRHPDGREFLAEGRLEGRVEATPRGTGGFGYDPVFFLPELGRTLAQLTLEEKNRLSHRARAIQALKPVLASLR